LLGVISAGGGSLRDHAGDSSRLVLTGVDGKALWFADSPSRLAGTVSLAELLDEFFDDTAAASPNAALEITAAPEGRDVVIIEVSNPRYRPTADRVVFNAVVLEDAKHLQGTRLHRHAERMTTRPPVRFDDATLFLDNAVACPADFGDPPVAGAIISLSRITCTDAQSVVTATIDGTLPCPDDDFGIADLGTLGTWACHSDPRGYASFSGTGSRSFSWTSATSDDVGTDPTAGYDLGPNKEA
jgi:hypothetical protein